MGERLGRQTPTCAVVLPYTESQGQTAVLLYEQSGRKTMPWQQLQLEDIMATNPNGEWTHMKYGYSVPRRNGKSEILIMRMIYGVTHGERVLYTAHRTTTSHSMWEKTVSILAKMGFIEKEDFKTVKQMGLERIEWLKGDGGVIQFRTRSTKGGLGEGYDLLIIDEAQEYTDDQETALQYIVTDSKNPQTIMCGTPPTVVSSGHVFERFRRKALMGELEDCGWAEWSVPEMSDIHDVDLWYETNPSLGTIFTERNVKSEMNSAEDITDKNIQRLGLWLSYNQKSAISREEWRSYAIDGKPDIGTAPKIFIGVKYASTGGTVSAAVAVKLSDGRIFVEALDCRFQRDGNAWLIGFMQNPHVRAVVIDGAGAQTILRDEMRDAGIKLRPVLLKVAEVVAANALFEKQLFGGMITHAGQPALEQIAANCEHRAIGTGGGFGYKSILDGADISLLDSVILAHWLCSTHKDRPKQTVGYG